MELALGTVQFGLPYGVAGRSKPVAESEVRAILEYASSNGIRLLDTATGYGDIEERLAELCSGLDFKVVSKIPDLGTHATVAAAAQSAIDAIRLSQDRLGGMLEAVLFHRADNLLADSGADLCDLVREAAGHMGLRLGVSCYSPEELISIRSRCDLVLAQVPGNAFDQRLRLLDSATELQSLELHLRSVFLQGLLLLPYEEAVRKIPAAKRPMAAWREWCDKHGFSSLVGALALAKGLPGVKYAVIGVDSLTQLEEIVAAWDIAPVVQNDEVACSDLELIDPRRWRPM